MIATSAFGFLNCPPLVRTLMIDDDDDDDDAGLAFLGLPRPRLLAEEEEEEEEDEEKAFFFFEAVILSTPYVPFLMQ